MSETPQDNKDQPREHDPDAVELLEQFNADLTEHDLDQILDDTSTAEIAQAAAQQTFNSAVQAEIADLHCKYGNAFAAFLTLEGIDLNEPGLEDRFRDCYQGSFTSQEEVANLHIQALGWQDQLDALIRTEAIPPGFLRWDYDAVLELIADGWDLVHLTDHEHIHQFTN